MLRINPWVKFSTKTESKVDPILDKLRLRSKLKVSSPAHSRVNPKILSQVKTQFHESDSQNQVLGRNRLENQISNRSQFETDSKPESSQKLIWGRNRLRNPFQTETDPKLTQDWHWLSSQVGSQHQVRRSESSQKPSKTGPKPKVDSETESSTKTDFVKLDSVWAQFKSIKSKSYPETEVNSWKSPKLTQNQFKSTQVLSQTKTDQSRDSLKLRHKTEVESESERKSAKPTQTSSKPNQSQFQPKSACIYSIDSENWNEPVSARSQPESGQTDPKLNQINSECVVNRKLTFTSGSQVESTRSRTESESSQTSPNRKPRNSRSRKAKPKPKSVQVKSTQTQNPSPNQ